MHENFNNTFLIYVSKNSIITFIYLLYSFEVQEV
jgi:hypothetical protein